MCVELGPEYLTPKSVGMLRKILSDFELKYGGLPGNQLRGFQSTQRHPLKSAYAGIVASRLEKLINQPNRDDHKIQSICDTPVTEEEAAKTGLNKIIVQCGDLIPDSLRKIVSMCSKGTLEELIDAGIITSAEALAPFIPPLVQSVMPVQYAPIRQFVGKIYTSLRIGRYLLICLRICQCIC